MRSRVAAPPAHQAASEPAPGAALLAAQRRLQGTQAALAAALLGDGSDPDVSASSNERPGVPARPRPRSPLVVQLAESAIAPWAEQRPWTLMALAAGTGALLASPRGRSMFGPLAAAILLAPSPARRGWQVLGQGLSLLVRRQPASPP